MANPTLLVETFDNDAGAFTVSGPERFDGGLWLEEGTTNLITNPSFESGAATGWSQVNTTAVIITDGFDGTKAAEVTADADGNVFFYQTVPFGTTLNTGDKFSGSVWIKAGAGYVGQTIQFRVENSVGNGLIGEEIVLTAEGQHYQRTATQNRDGETEVIFYVYKPGATAGFRYVVDAAQVELKTYSTSFFDGTRAASSASVPTAGHITPGSGSMALRYTRKIDTGSEETILTCGTAGSGTDYLELGIDASDHFYMEWNSNNAGAQRVTGTDAIATDTEYFLYADWSGTAIRLSVDNGTLATDTRDAVEGDWGAGDLELVA